MPDPRSRGPNPFTGQNNRGFSEGGYMDAAAFNQTVENVRLIFAPTRFEMKGLRYWRDAGQPGLPTIRMDISESGGPADRYFFIVPDDGPRVWGEKVYRVIVAWLEAFLEVNSPTTQVPTTILPTTLVPTT